MENLTHNFREINIALQLVYEREKSAFFCNIYFVRRIFFENLCFGPMYSVMNKPSEYIYFYVSKSITLCTFVVSF